MALWVVEPLGWRAAFWICVTPLLFVPVLARFMPESLGFLVAKGRLDEAGRPTCRFDVDLPAARAGKAPADRCRAIPRSPCHPPADRGEGPLVTTPRVGPSPR